MCKANSYVKVEKLGAQICRCTRQDLKIMPCRVLAYILLLFIPKLACLGLEYILRIYLTSGTFLLSSSKGFKEEAIH